MQKALISILAAALAAHVCFAQAPAAPAIAAKNPVVVIKTSMGTIKAELFADKTPATVANFLQYTKDKFYDGLIFHRVINGFMIQGGGHDAKMAKKATRAPIKNEAKTGVKNEVGTLAMARTGDPNSATAQFFISVVDNAFLDAANARDNNGYAVFGHVVAGMDVVDRILAVPTTNKGPYENVPVTPVLIKKATLEK